LSREELKGLEDNHFPFSGACDTATSGNTAGIYTEALGLALPHSGTLPAGSNYQLRAAKYTGMRIMDLLRDDVRPSQILTKAAFENAMRVGMAVGGSTNMVLHFIAMAKEAGVDVSFDTWDALSRSTPTLVKLAPSGPWGVTDLNDAGGVPGVMQALGNRINRDALTVSGKTAGDIADAALIEDHEVIRSRDNPVDVEGSVFILKGLLQAARWSRHPASRKPCGVARSWPGCSRMKRAPSARCGRGPSRQGPASSSGTRARKVGLECGKCSGRHRP
jgi:dihydroxy-acid dehydratase